MAAEVPETLRGRVRLGAWQITILLLVLVIGALFTAWWVVRDDPSPGSVPAPSPASPLVSMSGAPAQEEPSTRARAPKRDPTGVAPAVTPAVGATAAVPGTAASAGAGAGEVMVHLVGRVRRPGVLSLPEGARVVDAIRAAGGARRHRDLGTLNLARPLVDGEQIVVGRSASAAPPSTPDTGTAGSTGNTPGSAPTAPVDLNTATLEQLDMLPEVGPVTGQAILDWRETHGGFTAVEELLEVDGIGEATLAQVAPHVTV